MSSKSRRRYKRIMLARARRKRRDGQFDKARVYELLNRCFPQLTSRTKRVMVKGIQSAFTALMDGKPLEVVF